MRLGLVVAAGAWLALGCSGGGGDGGAPVVPTPSPTAVALRYPQFPPIHEPPIDPANPPTMTKLELGTYLFFDPRLSGTGFTACNNCHVFNTSFQDNLVKPRPDTSRGADFFTLKRNTESLFNIVYRKDFFRDGKSQVLSDALTLPWIEDNQQLGKTRQAAAEHLSQILRGIPGYVSLFRKAYDLDIEAAAPEQVFDTAGLALAIWVRQVVSHDSPFDRYNAGEDEAIDDSAKRGLAVFTTRGGCTACHFGANFTDNGFHNIGTSPPGEDGTRADEGRFDVTGRAEDRGRFQTPSLRHVSRSSPYFHDGSKATLLDVLHHLNESTALDPNHDLIVGVRLGLSDDDLLDLIAFLRSLRGDSVVLWGPKTPLYTQAEVDDLQKNHLPR